jgi:hypothetical protein
MAMRKSDYIQFILDNISAFSFNLPGELQDQEKLRQHLSRFEKDSLQIIASFNKNLLKYFFKISLKKDESEMGDLLKKLERLSSLIGPTKDLSYLSSDQIDYVLGKIESIEFDEINPENITKIADEQLEREFGGAQGQYSKGKALENQLASARFYLSSIGYPEEEINEKLEDAREDPSKLDALFNLEEKEIYGMPEELSASSSSSSQEVTSGSADQDIIDEHIKSLHQDISDERAQKAEKIVKDITSHVKGKMTDKYERVYKQMHPDRLTRAYKFLKDTKRKDDRMDLYLEWFFSSHLLENIELKVEHWQVSSSASHDNTGVYTAGFSFARYDPIIKEFSDKKLSKVLSITRKILKNPSKKRIQKLGQDLIAETGFDEHLYFTD